MTKAEPPGQSPRDKRGFHQRIWCCPVRLVTSGLWANLWSGENSRGSGVATSVLPVLSLHTYVTEATAKWTPGYRLPYLRISDLAGVNKGAVRPALRRLEAAELVRTWVPHSFRKKGKRRFFRCAAQVLYPQAGEAFVALPGSLFESGLWASFPDSGRGLYLVLRVLDRTQVRTPSLSQVSELSGLPLATLKKALMGLRDTKAYGLPLVEGFTPSASIPDVLADQQELVIPKGKFQGKQVGSLTAEEAQECLAKMPLESDYRPGFEARLKALREAHTQGSYSVLS